MTTAKITIKFSDDNGDTAGGSSPSDNTAYRIYRKADADPSNDSANLLYENTSPPQGTGVITFVDDGTNGTAPSVNTRYYYRVENVRGTTTALSALIGPIVVSDLDRLAYPENKPSDTDGVANYITVEPIVHYDATAEIKKHGDGYLYPRGSYFNNLSKRFSGLDHSFGGGGVHLGLDGVTPELRCHDSGTGYSGITLGVRDYSLFSAQFKDALGIDQDVDPRVVFDNGACCFIISPSISSHSTGTSYHMQHAGQHRSHRIFTCNIGGRQTNDVDPLLKIHKTLKYSDGQPWSDPEPWQNNPNPDDPGWYPRGTVYQRSNIVLDYGFYPRGGVSNGIRGAFHVSKGGFYPLAENAYTVPWSSNTDLWQTPKINVICRRIYPNGEYDFFVNGVKKSTNVGNHKSYLQIYRTPSGSDTLSGSWWDRENLLQDLNGNGTAEDLHMIIPPAIGLNSYTGQGMKEVSGFTGFPAGAHVINEAILIPDDLTANSDADFNRMVTYINNKYSSSPDFATQGDYS